MKGRFESVANEMEVGISAGKAVLTGDLVIPKGARGLVLFVHGSGSGRMSPRNRYVAHEINSAGMGTLLFDLLTKDEEAEDQITGRLRFDIGFLAERVNAATQWLRRDIRTRGLRIGYFGASTGAAAALVAATQQKDIAAIVSRGGRPDLAEGYLRSVKSPTLLIVGGDDEVVLDLNHKAYDELRAEKHLEIVRGATHLFEEPGALEEVTRLAKNWFGIYLK